MSHLISFHFLNPEDSRFLKIAHNLVQHCPQRAHQPIGAFLHFAGILNKEDDNFEQDCKHLIRLGTIDLSEKTGRGPCLEFDKTLFAKECPGTLERFCKGAQEAIRTNILSIQENAGGPKII